MLKKRPFLGPKNLPKLMRTASQRVYANKRAREVEKIQAEIDKITPRVEQLKKHEARAIQAEIDKIKTRVERLKKHKERMQQFKEKR